MSSPLAKAAAGVASLTIGVAVLAGGAAAGVTDLLGAGGHPGESSSPAGTGIPADYLILYESAAATCPGLPPAVLAAIGTIESGNGQSDAPGVRSGANAAGAEGPMQFEPATFAAYAQPIPPGGAVPPSPYDPVDAIYAAARMLCANGARDGANIPGAVFAYNHADWYVTQVLALASRYTTTLAAGSAAVAVGWALGQVGVPYRWGGDGNGGFDCSGLVQVAYAHAGIVLPRTAQQQYDTGPTLPTGTVLEPGDLVFYGTSPAKITHVGIVIDTGGDMIDAPHTGAQVRTEPIWPDMIGATRPG